MTNEKSQKINLGFTLIELLVVISIIGILIGLSIFGLQGARESSRDARRKADLEQLRSGLEIYKADCDVYPVGNGNPSTLFGSALVGDGSTTSCSVSNTYISQIPTDPTNPNRTYLYSSNGVTYELCAAVEQTTVGTVTCGGSSSCGASCNYKAINP